MAKMTLSRRLAASLSAALCIAPLFAGAATAATPDPNTPASITVNGDGSTTLTYKDGASFTSGGGISIQAGSFDWSASYSAGVFSRTWTTGAQGDIWINVGTISNCGVNQNLALYRDGFVDPQVGTTRIFGCGGGSFVWRDVPQGDFYFFLSDPNTGDSYFPHQVSGSVEYS